MATDLSSPGIPTFYQPQGYNPQYDSDTVDLQDRLNAVTPYQPTMPPAFPRYIRSTGPGVGDENYNVGYKMLPVPSGIVNERSYESPDVPFTHLSFSQSLYDSTLPRQQVSKRTVYTSLRAPGINEGFSY